MELTRSHVMPDGTAVHYRVWRAGRSRGAIVLLHGMASNLTRWSEFVEHTSLKNEWDILRPDLRGHGESFARGRIGAKVWSDDLIEILDAEGYERVAIIGHSLGAHVAMQFAARFPERVRGLVLIDPAFPKALQGNWRVFGRLGPLLQALNWFIRLLNALGLRRYKEFPRRDLREWDERVRREFLAAGLSEEFVARYSSTRVDLKYLPVSHYVQELVEMTRPLPEPSQLRVPMLVLLSRSVTYTDPAVTQRLIAAPHIEHADIEAYHWPLTEKPAEVRREIETWFTKRLGG
jgi:esterase